MTDLRLAALALMLSVTGVAQTPSKVPFQKESLRYIVNWPSGLNLGEAQLLASGTPASWGFALSLDAAIPGVTVTGSVRSTAAGEFCSRELLRQSAFGKRKTNEKTTFDAQSGKASRETLDGGGRSELQTPACGRDALTFLYYLRRELAEGRLPGPQTVYFGAPYQVRLEFGGSRTVKVNDLPTEADRIVASLKGPASQSTVEFFFARDTERTPVMVRVPLAAGTFSLELQR